MKTTISIIILGIASVLFFSKSQHLSADNKDVTAYRSAVANTKEIAKAENPAAQLWEEGEYKRFLSFEVFERAYRVYKNHSDFKSNIITIVDFSKPSSEKRLFIINLENNSLLYHTYVAHGKFSGENETENYSNAPQSKMSSLGFYKTAETYTGKHGLSLKLDGLEEGINHNARSRAVVIHGADYVSESFIKSHGRLGRSWGCPAVPQELSKEIIDTIKEGSCLYIYDENKDYFSKTKM